MVNPLLTVLFNLFLVGTALLLIAAMIQEYFAGRTPSVGGDRAHAMDRPAKRALPASAANSMKRAA
jgi:hypothetical protein